MPFYTKTGWPELRTPLPFGEIFPLLRRVCEGFWDRELTSMPGGYWGGIPLSRLCDRQRHCQRTSRKPTDKIAPDVSRYPYLTCEIGGGMMNSYHRRILIEPGDVESTALVKSARGALCPGYYMYHGGENPDGKLTTLQETQATGFWNDLPVKNYDFQAPLGEYGQIRPQYHLLRRIHLFLHEWGPLLADPASFTARPSACRDVTIRAPCGGVRARMEPAGFVFVNNCQRSQPMRRKAGSSVRPETAVGFSDVSVTPGTPCLPNSRFIWPFNLDLGYGVRSCWATAQPVTAVDDGTVRTVFFAETPGVPAQFGFAEPMSKIRVLAGRAVRQKDAVVIGDLKPGTAAAIRVHGNRGHPDRPAG